MQGFLVKNRFGQFETTPESEDDFGSVCPGEIVRVKMDMPRNLSFQRKFYAMLKVAFENQDQFDSFEIFRKKVIIESGFCKLVQVEGQTIFIADSISFASCDEIKFRGIYDKVLSVILEKYCHGLTPEEMDKKVLAIMDFS
jgi:hypothetical protein